MIAIDRDLVDLAETCLIDAEAFSSHGPRQSIILDLLRAKLMIKRTTEEEEEDYTQRRVYALKLVERAMVSARRVRDEWLIHQSIFAAWEIGMHLLTKRHRGLVHRIFSLCTEVLEEIESPQLELRSRLHFEVANCELQSDFLAKAVVHVDRALDLDYGDLSHDDDVKEDEEEDETKRYVTKNRVRYLDKYLIPMKRELEIRSSVYVTLQFSLSLSVTFQNKHRTDTLNPSLDWRKHSSCWVRFKVQAILT